MNNLRTFNELIYNKYLSLDNINLLSSPLLVSSKKYLENLSNKKIMYIGQETNRWVNEGNEVIRSINDIEDSYDYFLLDKCTSSTIFWQFIKNILDVNYNELHKNIIWTNTLLCGNRFEKGTPCTNDKLNNISLEYLLFLYDYFKPDYIINVSGNRNPYYNITTKFLNELGITLDYPTKSNPVVIKDNIIWTYHPLFLKRSKLENNVKDEIKRLIK